MNRRIQRGKVLKWTVFASAALLATRLFFVQQLIAAFLIFSVLFACLAVVVLVVFALDLAWQTALGRAEAYVMVLSHAVRRGPAPINSTASTTMLAPALAHRIASHTQQTRFQ